MPFVNFQISCMRRVLSRITKIIFRIEQHKYCFKKLADSAKWFGRHPCTPQTASQTYCLWDLYHIRLSDISLSAGWTDNENDPLSVHTASCAYNIWSEFLRFRENCFIGSNEIGRTKQCRHKSVVKILCTHAGPEYTMPWYSFSLPICLWDI